MSATVESVGTAADIVEMIENLRKYRFAEHFRRVGYKRN
jgi:hypothetical protein